MMRFRFWILLGFTLLLSVGTALAQDACPALVQQALEAVGSNCSDLSRNTACYGYTQVDAIFAENTPDVNFSQPSDVAALRALESIQTAPMDLDNDKWGVAVMSVQANIPNTLPGQSVTFLLLGDVRVDNAVTADEAFAPADAVDVTAASLTNILESPALIANALNTLQPGTVLPADGYSVDGEWLRVAFENQVGWVQVGAITDGTGLDLPTISATNRTPMQAFYFTTGIGQPLCNEAESALAIQSPDNLQVELTVNGVDISVGSTIVMKNTDQNTVIITVKEGHVETVDGIVIEEGQTVEATLDEQGNVISFSEVRPATADEQQLGSNADAGFTSLGLNDNADEDITVIETDDSGDGGSFTNDQGQLIHIVAPGENLFRIALQYEASMQAIMNANGITDPRLIFVGQRLIIPNPGSGFVGIPGLGDQTQNTDTGNGGEDGPPVGTGCDGFVQTSPLGGAPVDGVTFYWDPPASGATHYVVNLFNSDGGFAGSVKTQGSETNLPINLGQVGVGGNFQWQVVAYSGDQQICATGVTSPMIVDAPVVVETPEPAVTNLSAIWGCAGFATAVSWQNGTAGETITVVVYDIASNTYTASGSGASGSVSFPYIPYNIATVIVTGSVSGTVTLAGGAMCY